MPIPPPPRDQLAGCMWLPRILGKARLLQTGDLPAAYAARFGGPSGVDEVFLGYFQLTKEAIIRAAIGTDDEASAWFLSRPGITPERIREWNHIAVNLGRPGFPLEGRVALGLSGGYAHVAHLKPDNIFTMLELDEGISRGH